MSLSSLIVQREAATMRQVEEALARQVIYGGDLVTNLLEVARVDETVLAKLLAESMKLPMAPTGELPIPAGRVRALVPPQMASQRSVVPLSLEDEKTLVLAVAEPLPRELEEQLAFALGMALEQRAATSVRVRQAIARVYGVPLERRMQRLLARLSGQASTSGSMPPPLGAMPSIPVAPSVPSAPPSRSGTPSYGTTLPHMASPLSGVPMRRTKTISGLPAMHQISQASAPPAPVPFEPVPSGPVSSAPAAAVADGAPPAVAREPEAADASPDSDVPLTPLAGGRRGGLLQRDVSSSVRAPRRRRGPITAELARHESEEAADRDALLDLFFDFSRQYFDYAALFLVHGDIAEGRDAFGDGAARERVVGIGVPLDLPGMMSSVKSNRAPLVARAPDDGLEAELLADLNRPRDVELAIVPLVVRTRVVAILLGDCGDSGIDRATSQEVVGFAGVIGKAFERLIVRRKLDGFIAGSKSTGAGRVDPAMLASATAAPRRQSSRPPAARGTHSVPPPSTAPPPAMNLAALRPISGPPIPREEPDSDHIPMAPVPRIPRLEDVSEPRIEDIDSGPDSKALFDELGWETSDDQDPLPPPSAAIAVPPHLPPLRRNAPAVELPSVIVDIDQELASIVNRIVAGEADDSDEGELVRQGERAMRVIMTRFPGPVNFDRSRIATMAAPPRASDCGVLLRLVVRVRRVALPFILQRLTDADAEARGWATHLLSELPYPEAISGLLAALRDADASTRASAGHALAAIARGHAETVRNALSRLARAVDPAERVAAMRAMSLVRDPMLVPDLVHALGDREEIVLVAAHDALVNVTCQDFGADARPWLRWWESNAAKHRIEWLIDALMHEVSEIRRLAADQLRALSKEYFGYGSDLPVRDRERAQQRYRDWWITEGRARFKVH